jgi:hypothetical protein
VAKLTAYGQLGLASCAGLVLTATASGLWLEVLWAAAKAVVNEWHAGPEN